jgi:8-oxo-dGTP diphosphatase
MADTRRRIEVAAAVIYDQAGRILLAQRPRGKAFEGYWEFPGGKVEAGESAAAAICRELHEELGIEVREACPWLTREFDYSHALVRLRFFRIYDWRGVPHGREGQQFAWQDAAAPEVMPILPANGPILRALQLPEIYGITQAGAVGTVEFMSQLEGALSRGLKLIQVREKALGKDQLRRFTVEIIAAARCHKARVLINGDAALAKECGADGVHLTTPQIRALDARPDCDWVAASCHNAEELRIAEKLGADFSVLGPVMPTPTHPGAPVLGWPGFAALVRDSRVPVFALGGLQRADLVVARRNGAHGIAMLRGAWLPA